MDLGLLDIRLRDIYRRPAWIVVAEVAAAATPLVAGMRQLGVEQFMIIAPIAGVGDLPRDAVFHYIEIEASTVMQTFRQVEQVLRRMPEDLRSALSRFDPAGEAGAIASPPVGIHRVGGRTVYGGRPPEWISLEDKTLLHEILDRAGVERAPSEVVEVGSAAAAAARLGSPAGTVWTADNTEGWHGGGEYTRLVRDPGEATVVEAWFGGCAERVRVMPFLDGIPCSIHGFVTGDGVAAFRPVEMLVARRPNRSRFFYMGMATTWDPPPDVRAEMRAAARRVGETLRDLASYRGPFSIDGVATSGGFRPTEINPRLSPGLGIQAATVEGFHFGLASRAVIAGDLDLPWQWIEETVSGSADRRRVAQMGAVVHERVAPNQVAVAVAGDTIIPVGDDDGEGRLTVGPTVTGSYVRLRLDPGRIPTGRSMAPWAISALYLAGDRWGFDVPELEGAPDVCA